MVYLLVLYFSCYQQDAEIQKKYCSSDKFDVAALISDIPADTPWSQREATTSVTGYFASRAGCESAIAKAQADEDAIDRHMADTHRGGGENGYLRSAHFRCDAKELKP